MEVTNAIKTQPKEIWRVRVEKDLVQQVDELKWQCRTSRKNLVHRMFRLCLKLWNQVDDYGVSQFERLEQAMEVADNE